MDTEVGFQTSDGSEGTMNRRRHAAIAAWGLVGGLLMLGMVAGGCASRPEEQLVAHLDQMVTALEQNKDDALKAAEALEAYVATHKGEIEALARDLAERRATLSREDLAALADQVLREVGPIMERTERLLAERPALATNERIRNALASVSASTL